MAREDWTNCKDLEIEYLTYRDAVEATVCADCREPLSAAIAGDAAVGRIKGKTDPQWLSDWRQRLGRKAAFGPRLLAAIRELKDKKLWPWD